MARRGSSLNRNLATAKRNLKQVLSLLGRARREVHRMKAGGPQSVAGGVRAGVDRAGGGFGGGRGGGGLAALAGDAGPSRFALRRTLRVAGIPGGDALAEQAGQAVGVSGLGQVAQVAQLAGVGGGVGLLALIPAAVLKIREHYDREFARLKADIEERNAAELELSLARIRREAEQASDPAALSARARELDAGGTAWADSARVSDF